MKYHGATHAVNVPPMVYKTFRATIIKDSPAQPIVDITERCSIGIMSLAPGRSDNPLVHFIKHIHW